MSCEHYLFQNIWITVRRAAKRALANPSIYGSMIKMKYDRRRGRGNRVVLHDRQVERPRRHVAGLLHCSSYRRYLLAAASVALPALARSSGPSPDESQCSHGMRGGSAIAGIREASCRSPRRFFWKHTSLDRATRSK